MVLPQDGKFKIKKKIPSEWNQIRSSKHMFDVVVLILLTEKIVRCHVSFTCIIDMF